MKLSENSKGEFTLHPETEGPIKAVIVDITPAKEVENKFRPGETKTVFRLVYETEMTDDNGKRFCVWSKPYTASLNEKSTFRKDVKKLMGRDLTAAELHEFDTDGLLGLGVKLIVQHEVKEDKTYDNITFIKPDPEAMKPSGKYVRVQDRPARDDAQGGGGSGSASSYKKAPAAKEDEGRAPWQKVKVHVGQHSGVDLGDLDSEAVEKLIEKWLPVGKALPKPLKADRELIAALDEVAALLNPAETEPAAEPAADY